MAYFDSPKNRMMWEMELDDLRQKKADFAAGRYMEPGETSRERPLGARHRKPVTFEQLEREEAMSGGRRREGSREAAKERDGMSRKPSKKPLSMDGKER